ncbi:hypothetical protein NHX12_023980 [Muraenolepis orangiensis]|uniref:Uncharacterized protein n=1 Tax=Muraenolepis orangiensis TaxID=630683 RepID=A0A9Q0ISK9_9TELE|nr:hypothetical protein NHX12_023980 [Muraenolepis orangiensis]
MINRPLRDTFVSSAEDTLCTQPLESAHPPLYRHELLATGPNVSSSVIRGGRRGRREGRRGGEEGETRGETGGGERGSLELQYVALLDLLFPHRSSGDLSVVDFKVEGAVLCLRRVTP